MPNIDFGTSGHVQPYVCWDLSIRLDSYAASVVGCALVVDIGELVRMVLAPDPAVVWDWIRRFEDPVKLVYESGPTGCVLAR